MLLAKGRRLVCAVSGLLGFGEQTTLWYPTVETNQQARIQLLA